MMKMMTLREAHEQGKLGQFITEREAKPQGDQAAFNATLKAMAGTLKSARGTSNGRRSAD
jgi:hypothetical protein